MNPAILLLGAQIEQKRGEQHLRSSLRILLGINGAPEKVKAGAYASWRRADQTVAAFTPAIRAFERGNVVFIAGRRRKG